MIETISDAKAMAFDIVISTTSLTQGDNLPHAAFLSGLSTETIVSYYSTKCKEIFLVSLLFAVFVGACGDPPERLCPVPREAVNL